VRVDDRETENRYPTQASRAKSVLGGNAKVSALGRTWRAARLEGFCWKNFGGSSFDRASRAASLFLGMLLYEIRKRDQLGVMSAATRMEGSNGFAKLRCFRTLSKELRAVTQRELGFRASRLKNARKALPLGCSDRSSSLGSVDFKRGLVLVASYERLLFFCGLVAKCGPHTGCFIFLCGMRLCIHGERCW